MDAQTNLQGLSQEHEKAIIAWLVQNALPVQTVEAGNGFSDLQPLKQLLKDVKVVGLGETTHGTREFFQMKHRLVEFLVTEMGFTTFALEASFSACQPINEYVLYGKGERAAVLTDQWYVVWDTEEFSDLLDWMRAYNQGKPDEKKVRFQGLDVTRNGIGRQVVLNYLGKVAPDRLAETQTLFEAFAREDDKWPRRIDDEARKILVQLLPQLQDLREYLIAHQDDFARRSSFEEWDQALQYTRVMQQFIQNSTPDLLPASQAKGRGISMAENLIYVVSRAKPDAKFILWAHNAHLRLPNDPILKPNLGSTLQAKFGSAYFAFGFEFNQGSFLTRTSTPEGLLADLKVVTLPQTRAGSFSWFLSHIHHRIFILNLRAQANHPIVEHWLETPQPIHHVNWAYNPAEKEYLELRSPRKYDGIIFIESTTASKPTGNALRTVAAGDGL